jgi:maltooligosyltrehalose synthase
MRRAHAALFRDGDYLPLRTTGAAAAHLVAYARREDGVAVVVVVSRLFAKLLGAPDRLPEGLEAWGDAQVALDELGAEDRFVDQLSGRVLRAAGNALDVASVLAGFPAAVLLGRMSAAGARSA